MKKKRKDNRERVLKALRVRALTAGQLATRLKVHPSAVYRILRQLRRLKFIYPEVARRPFTLREDGLELKRGPAEKKYRYVG